MRGSLRTWWSHSLLPSSGVSSKKYLRRSALHEHRQEVVSGDGSSEVVDLSAHSATKVEVSELYPSSPIVVVKGPLGSLSCSRAGVSTMKGELGASPTSARSCVEVGPTHEILSLKAPLPGRCTQVSLELRGEITVSLLASSFRC